MSEEGGGIERLRTRLHARLTSDDCDAIKLAALLWVGFMALSAVSITLAQGARTGGSLQWAAPWQYAWILTLPLLAIPASFGVFRLMLRLAARPAVVRLSLVAPMVVIAAVAQALYDHETGVLLARLSHARPLGPLNSQALILNINSYLGVYALYACLVELGTVRARALRFSQKAAEHALQSAEARELARKAQLELLWFQLNPHFLFNTLNNVISMVVSDKPDRATVMLRRLSTYLRATLDLNGNAFLSLELEMAAVEAYAEIESVRFDGSLELQIDYPPSLRPVPVPALILQPIIENAIKYAVAPSRGVATITVRAWRSQGLLWLEVTDTGLSADATSPGEPGTGLGLGNVADRLAAQYGDRAGVQTEPKGRGFRVRIHLPLSQ
ncbi:MAG: hypothetical protein EON90_06305 [Brevundimonas sp.]|nr:MAG: hypothetical protein EON90_06305 [Brevundimonas sp.]